MGLTNNQLKEVNKLKSQFRCVMDDVELGIDTNLAPQEIREIANTLENLLKGDEDE